MVTEEYYPCLNNNLFGFINWIDNVTTLSSFKANVLSFSLSSKWIVFEGLMFER